MTTNSPLSSGSRPATPPPTRAHRAPLRRCMTWTAIALFAIAGVLLALEYRTHLSTLLPWLILLACPLMHVFMHRGHGQRHRNKP